MKFAIDDPMAPKHGLPPSLRVPIAASSLAAVEGYVGAIARRIPDTRVGSSYTKAVLVHAYDRAVEREPGVRLWQESNAVLYEERLFPSQQVWVHVDYPSYRRAYQQLIGEVPAGYFLDHIQNRRAVRQWRAFALEARNRGYETRTNAHNYLRLCPVTRRVNTSGGGLTGGEGMENEFAKSRLMDLRAGTLLRDQIEAHLSLMTNEIIYADPMDLTKMLNEPPGTKTLPRVGEIEELFFKA